MEAGDHGTLVLQGDILEYTFPFRLKRLSTLINNIRIYHNCFHMEVLCYSIHKASDYIGSVMTHYTELSMLHNY